MESKDFEPVYKIVMPPEPVISPLIYADDSDILYSKHHGKCDMLVLSKHGYLTEIEIKRSWKDFVADFKKSHSHDGNGIIKYFYYCVPQCLLERVYNKLEELKIAYSGIITYSEDLRIRIHGHRYAELDGSYSYHIPCQRQFRKLSLEEQLQVARFGAMRAIKLKEKLINNEQY